MRTWRWRSKKKNGGGSEFLGPDYEIWKMANVLVIGGIRSKSRLLIGGHIRGKSWDGRKRGLVK
jgi:hypothetical protein